MFPGAECVLCDDNKQHPNSFSLFKNEFNVHERIEPKVETVLSMMSFNMLLSLYLSRRIIVFRERVVSNTLFQMLNFYPTQRVVSFSFLLFPVAAHQPVALPCDTDIGEGQVISRDVAEEEVAETGEEH